ncbi:hypothetical protein HDU96_004593, partial [Phlyctochytrium bullatum]
ATVLTPPAPASSAASLPWETAFEDLRRALERADPPIAPAPPPSPAPPARRPRAPPRRGGGPAGGAPGPGGRAGGARRGGGGGGGPRGPLGAAGGVEMRWRLPRGALVVDDNLINQRLLSRLLEKVGIPTWTACDGYEALEALFPRSPSPPHHPDVEIVFMDLEMPRMDGVTAAAEIRRRERETAGARRLVVVGVAGQCGEEGGAAGMDAWLVKPFQLEDLARVCRVEVGERV